MSDFSWRTARSLRVAEISEAFLEAVRVAAGEEVGLLGEAVARDAALERAEAVVEHRQLGCVHAGELRVGGDTELVEARRELGAAALELLEIVADTLAAALRIEAEDVADHVGRRGCDFVGDAALRRGLGGGKRRGWRRLADIRPLVAGALGEDRLAVAGAASAAHEQEGDDRGGERRDDDDD